MKTLRKITVLLLAATAAGCGQGDTVQVMGMRKPVGIYAFVDARSFLDSDGVILPNTYKSALTNLVSNPAVSGIAVEVGWNTLNPNAPGSARAFDWRALDFPFNAVETWNQAHPSERPKTVAVVAQPGFNTPAWALSEMPPTCNSVFQVPPVEPDGVCGQATFWNSEGTNNPQLQPLPLPWNSTYQRLWRKFLVALAGRYESNPSFASMAIDGPTATSAEVMLPLMSLPNPLPLPSTGWPLPPEMAGQSQVAMWSALIASPSADAQHHSDPAYQNSDQIFIDAWEAAIDMYGEVFDNVTFTISTGNQLPNFPGGDFIFHPSNAFDAQACAADYDMDCQAESAILDYFVQPSVGGNNDKASMTSGLNASPLPLNMGIEGAELLAANTPVSPPVLGGAEFATSFSQQTAAQGCTAPPMGSFSAAAAPCANLTPLQALENTLQRYFNGTPAGESYEAANGVAALNFLFIYSVDIDYANANPSTQAVLNDASYNILSMAR